MYALYINTTSYQMGFQTGLYAFTAAVLGGIGNMPGAVLGGLVIGLVRSLGSVYVGETLEQCTDLRDPHPDPGVPAVRTARCAHAGEGMSKSAAAAMPGRLGHLPTVLWILFFVAAFLYPLIPGLDDRVFQITQQPVGGRLTSIFVYAILALGLNVVVGNAGLLQLGIGAFFGFGAYITGILTVEEYPFQVQFLHLCCCVD